MNKNPFTVYMVYIPGNRHDTYYFSSLENVDDFFKETISNLKEDEDELRSDETIMKILKEQYKIEEIKVY
ncbi:hypothetical protein UFOVP1290_403 [uncultured Caudovirales phage]|uniref:Uncharacterized protein n=1 Tax=uncultured Caudovirales phage TaxID=2100421 RepID=A0A6J5RHL6_9CAUD|nr:hypothetical protein UFOVP1290_403 [uncultured Caudovirales phage]